MKFTAKNVAYLGMITAISVIANALSWPISSIGGAIAFTYIPNFVAGYFFGPGAGFLVGVLGDVLGCIIWPKGAWLPLITLASGLMGMIPGLVRYIPVPKRWHVLISYLLVFIVCSEGINAFAYWHAFAATKKTFWVYLIGKMQISVINMIVNLVINFMLMPVFDRIIAPRIRGMQSASEQQVPVAETVSASAEEAEKDPND